MLHEKQMVVRPGWGNSQEKLILFLETEAAGSELQNSSTPRPPLTGSKWLLSSQHNFEGIAGKIKCRRKSDTSLFDTKEGEKKWDLGCPASGTTLAWERGELQDGVTAQRIQGDRKVVSCWNLLHKSVPQLPVIPEFTAGLHELGGLLQP